MVSPDSISSDRFSESGKTLPDTFSDDTFSDLLSTNWDCEQGTFWREAIPHRCCCTGGRLYPQNLTEEVGHYGESRKTVRAAVGKCGQMQTLGHKRIVTAPTAMV